MGASIAVGGERVAREDWLRRSFAVSELDAYAWRTAPLQYAIQDLDLHHTAS